MQKMGELGRIYIMCCLVFMSGSALLRAQEPGPHPSFHNFGTNDGLPSPEVYCIMQDHLGYMWFGTDNGASRFNGYTFTNFGPANGLQSNVVFNIVEDSSNRIWFGTMSGELFIFENDTIVPYRYNNLILNYRNRYSIVNLLHVNNEQQVTLSLRGLGILQINGKGGHELITTQTPLGGLVVLDNNKIWKAAVGRTKDANYWDVSYDHYIRQVFYVEIVNNNQTDTIVIKKRAINGTPFNAFLIDSTRYIFLLQAFNNIYLIDNKEILWQKEFNECINSVQLQKNGTLLVSMNKEAGLRVYDNANDIRYEKYEQLLVNVDVSQSFFDKNGGLWVSTLDKGLLYCSDKEMLVWDRELFGMGSNLVTAIAPISEKEIFIGLNNGSVNMVNVATGQIKKLTLKTNANQHYVYFVYYDFNRNKLYSNGSLLTNDNNWMPVQHKLPNVKSGILLTNYGISQDGKYMWGGSTRGFYKVDLSANRAVLHSDIELNITDRIFSIHEDKRGNLWLGLQTGITQFIDGCLIPPDVKHPSFHVRVEAITETADSTLVFGTKGLGVVFWKDSKIISIMEKDGLTSNMIENIHVDENGTIWVATLSGLNKITLSAGGKPVVKAITIAQGLPSNEIYQVASLNGQVWLATGGGLVKYHELPPAKTAAPPFLTNLQVNAQKVAFTQNVFPHYQNNIEITYLNINYCLHGKINYRYRLNNQNPWIETYNTSVNLPALKAGNYTFEVQAQNEDALWSTSATYGFSVLPPWWERWPFRIATLAVILLAVTVGYRNRIQQLRLKNETQQKIYELEGKALQAQMNPHFIFNCLNSIKELISRNETEKALDYLHKFAKLVRSNLMVSRRGEIVLSDEIEMLSGYLNLEKMRFKDVFDFTIDVDPQIDIYDYFLPPMLVQPFVENAVIHAFKNPKVKGHIWIRFKQIDQGLVISITDNGIGLHANKDNETAPHVSQGVALVKDRLALINGGKEENYVTLQEIVNADGTTGGTEARIFLIND